MKKSVEIAQLGHPVLRLQAKKINDVHSTEIIAIISNMLLALSESNGVGIAAPQIFESFRMIIIASRPSSRYPLAPEMKPIAMINPSFEYLSDSMKKDWEGCLSIPEIRALVPRYEKIKIFYTDQQGYSKDLIADDFIARIFQHEYDHLNGLLYLDRVENNRDIISEIEFQKLMNA